MATFNGHKNWNHWNVSIWINNDEGLYRLAQSCIRATDNRDQAVKMFRDELCGTLRTPDGAPYSCSAVRSAFVGIS